MRKKCPVLQRWLSRSLVVQAALIVFVEKDIRWDCNQWSRGLVAEPFAEKGGVHEICECDN